MKGWIIGLIVIAAVFVFANVAYQVRVRRQRAADNKPRNNIRKMGTFQ